MSSSVWGSKVRHEPPCGTWGSYLTSNLDSDMARDAFATFIPLSVESDARTKIIFDFFDLMAAIAAHGKTNGMGGRKLSRLAGWWAFEQVDAGNGFDGGYKSWSRFVDPWPLDTGADELQRCRCYKSLVFRLSSITFAGLCSRTKRDLGTSYLATKSCARNSVSPRVSSV
jgi:hypothetical protein